MLVLKFPSEIQAFDIGAEMYSFCAILRHVNFNLTMYRKENPIQENMNLISRAPARLVLKIQQVFISFPIKHSHKNKFTQSLHIIIMFHFFFESPWCMCVRPLTMDPSQQWHLPVLLSDKLWMTRHVRDVCGQLGSTAHNPTESIWGFELFSQFSSSKYHNPHVFNLHSASQTGIQRFCLIFCAK